MSTAFDILEPYADGFADVLRKIDEELATIRRELKDKELGDAVQKDLNFLMEKYREQIETTGRNPDQIKEKYQEHLVEKRRVSLKEAQDKLERLKSEILSVAPPSVYRREYAPQQGEVRQCT